MIVDLLDENTVYSASDAAAAISLLPDGRSFFGIAPDDKTGVLLQECVRNN